MKTALVCGAGGFIGHHFIETNRFNSIGLSTEGCQYVVLIPVIYYVRRYLVALFCFGFKWYHLIRR